MKEINADQSGLILSRNIVFLPEFGQNMYFAFKRTFDVFMAILGIFCLLPIGIIVGIAIKMEDGGPVIYRQKRIGKDGVRFKLYKFRSMRVDADEFLAIILKNNPEMALEFKKTAKINDDPRITKVGKFIRKTSLDELPQLFNILKGDMSVVGPRPLVDGELDAHGGDFITYNSVRPGLTGWWACNGRSDVEDYGERLKLEYYYVENCGLKLDAQCILKTFTAVVSSKGAK